MEDKKLKYLEKERAFNKGLQDLKSAPVEMVDDFQKPVAKNFPVDRIGGKGQVQQIKSGGDFMADQIIRNAEKEAKQAALGKIGDTLDYSKFKGLAKTGGKKLLGALPLVGAGYAALQGDSAMAADELAGDIPVAGQVYEAIKPTMSGPAPGSLDDRLERGLLTDEDKLLLKQQALQNMRR